MGIWIIGLGVYSLVGYNVFRDSMLRKDVSFLLSLFWPLIFIIIILYGIIVPSKYEDEDVY